MCPICQRVREFIEGEIKVADRRLKYIPRDTLKQILEVMNAQ